MKLDRRQFLEALGAGAAMAGASARGETPSPPSDPNGILVDTTTCVGCRKCEWACDQVNGGLSGRSLGDFEDFSVFNTNRWMDAQALTVVNRFPNEANPEKPIFVKSQCMHCLKPACASACLVRALTVADTGAVVYDAHKCMGCRYCMVACPFQVPAYEYDNPLTPRVMKCSFCFETKQKEGKIPACAEVCPPMALTFGKRSELLNLAHQKIETEPDRYIDHVYGENEVGGTAWLYLASKEFENLGFLKLGDHPTPSLTEAIQHGIFKFGIPPLLLFGLLGAAMFTFREREGEETEPMAEVAR